LKSSEAVFQVSFGFDERELASTTKASRKKFLISFCGAAERLTGPPPLQLAHGEQLH